MIPNSGAISGLDSQYNVGEKEGQRAPEAGRPAYENEIWTEYQRTYIQKQSGPSHEKAVPGGDTPRLAGLGEAARPHLVASGDAISCEV